MSVIVDIGLVAEPNDPELRGRLKVLAPQFNAVPIWCLPAMEPGLFAIPNEGDPVLVMRLGPNNYRWKALGISRDEALPAWALVEYPRRRALYGDSTLFGIDEAGDLFVGHFGATEAAVLGNVLKTKLEALCDAIISGLDMTATSTANGFPLSNAAAVQTAKASVQTVKGQLGLTLSSIVKIASTETT